MAASASPPAAAGHGARPGVQSSNPPASLATPSSSLLKGKPKPIWSIWKFVYAAPAFALAAAGIFHSAYQTKYYVDDLGMDPKQFALANALVRSVDLFSYPLFGFLVDNTFFDSEGQSFRGRRKPFILLSAPIVGATYFLLYAAPKLTDTALFAWYTGIAIVYNAAPLSLSYFSLGSELTQQYDEQASVFGWVHVLGCAGMIAGSLIPGIIASNVTAKHSTTFPVIALALSLLVVLTFTILAANTRVAVPERRIFRKEDGGLWEQPVRMGEMKEEEEEEEEAALEDAGEEGSSGGQQLEQREQLQQLSSSDEEQGAGEAVAAAAGGGAGQAAAAAPATGASAVAALRRRNLAGAGATAAGPAGQSSPSLSSGGTPAHTSATASSMGSAGVTAGQRLHKVSLLDRFKPPRECCSSFVVRCGGRVTCRCGGASADKGSKGKKGSDAASPPSSPTAAAAGGKEGVAGAPIDSHSKVIREAQSLYGLKTKDWRAVSLPAGWWLHPDMQSVATVGVTWATVKDVKEKWLQQLQQRRSAEAGVLAQNASSSARARQEARAQGRASSPSSSSCCGRLSDWLSTAYDKVWLIICCRRGRFRHLPGERLAAEGAVGQSPLAMGLDQLDAAGAAGAAGAGAGAAGALPSSQLGEGREPVIFVRSSAVKALAAEVRRRAEAAVEELKAEAKGVQQQYAAAAAAAVSGPSAGTAATTAGTTVSTLSNPSAGGEGAADPNGPRSRPGSFTDYLAAHGAAAAGAGTAADGELWLLLTPRNYFPLPQLRHLPVGVAELLEKAEAEGEEQGQEEQSTAAAAAVQVLAGGTVSADATSAARATSSLSDNSDVGDGGHLTSRSRDGVAAAGAGLLRGTTTATTNGSRVASHPDSLQNCAALHLRTVLWAFQHSETVEGERTAASNGTSTGAKGSEAQALRKGGAGGTRLDRPLPLISGATWAWRNLPFRVLTIVAMVLSLASVLSRAMLAFYVEYVLQPQKFELWLGIMLTAELVAAAGSAPFWYAVSKRLDHKRAWMMATALAMPASLFAFLRFGPGDVNAFLIYAVWAGLTEGGASYLIRAMRTSTIDYDNLYLGMRREAQYLTYLAIFTHWIDIPAAGIGLTALSAAGYQRGAKEQNAAVVQLLKVLAYGVPLLFVALGWALAAFFPISRTTHAQLFLTDQEGKEKQGQASSSSSGATATSSSSSRQASREAANHPLEAMVLRADPVAAGLIYPAEVYRAASADWLLDHFSAWTLSAVLQHRQWRYKQELQRLQAEEEQRRRAGGAGASSLDSAGSAGGGMLPRELRDQQGVYVMAALGETDPHTAEDESTRFLQRQGQRGSYSEEEADGDEEEDGWDSDAEEHEEGQQQQLQGVQGVQAPGVVVTEGREVHIGSGRHGAPTHAGAAGMLGAGSAAFSLQQLEREAQAQQSPRLRLSASPRRRAMRLASRGQAAAPLISCCGLFNACISPRLFVPLHVREILHTAFWGILTAISIWLIVLGTDPKKSTLAWIAMLGLGVAGLLALYHSLRIKPALQLQSASSRSIQRFLTVHNPADKEVQLGSKASAGAGAVAA